MQKFFIHKDDQQQGPFSVTELRNLKITRETMVWFEGAEHWTKASEIDELNNLFKSVPPPLQMKTSVTPPPISGVEKSNVNSVTTDLDQAKKSYAKIALVVAVISFGVIGAFVYVNQQNKQAEIEQQLQVQNAKIQEQEKIEAERLANEQKQKREADASQKQAELETLKYQYDEAVTNLRATKIKLDEIQQFHLLRTPAEKEEQVQSQLETIRSFENEVDRLKTEIDKY